MDTVHECDRQTDRRTDRRTDRITITDTVQTASHGKNSAGGAKFILGLGPIGGSRKAIRPWPNLFLAMGPQGTSGPRCGVPAVPPLMEPRGVLKA